MNIAGVRRRALADSKSREAFGRFEQLCAQPFYVSALTNAVFEAVDDMQRLVRDTNDKLEHFNTHRARDEIATAFSNRNATLLGRT